MLIRTMSGINREAILQHSICQNDWKKMAFLTNYSENFHKLIDEFDQQKFDDCEKLIKECSSKGGKVILVGNGGSAAMASHISVDLSKACSIRSTNFNEPDLITCFANDYGYENWVTEALKTYADKDDLVILISSSGNSQNIVNAAKHCINQKINLITLSGFEKNNKINNTGMVNIWVDSSYYNFVEMAHHLFLVALVDAMSLGRSYL